MKFRAFLVLVAVLLLLAAAVFAFREARWRSEYPLVDTTGTPSPDGAWTAEVRRLPEGLGLGSGVFLRKEGDLLRSLKPRLVFVGSCEPLSTRWFGQRRLVITCEVRSGEPVVMQELVEDVKIELVVDRHFG
ncbi:hypothetical protein H8N03_02905 [Ramlibacter sp. USB13]|uniref:Uncharacterized protein n=1 Tax=Ramlibacter cellulosilyticus TaxID=2764187 RepID=A0A923MNE2_9BURK|nr:hypothetical protein [Ramlibacter cellulosilyticus]MBC5781876.1 hypothetical protein [Ramlibacter cellulosilyticus]